MILITSDEHFHAYQTFSRLMPDGLNSRLIEMLVTGDAAIEVGKKHGCTAHLHCGDTFDRKNSVDAVTYAEVAKLFSRGVDAGMQQIVVKGNHDLAAGGVRNSLETLGLLSGVRVIDTAEQIDVEGISLNLVPYDDDANRQKAWIEEFARRDASKPAVLVAHTEVQGAKTGSEFRLNGRLVLSDLYPQRFRYVFLGHIHEPQTLAEGETFWVGYVGSMVQRNFSDVGSPRSCIIFDPKTLAIQRVYLPGPRFYVEHVSLRDELPLVKVDGMGYYSIVLHTRDVSGADVDRHFDGRCRGWAWSYELGETSTPRIGHAKSWPDVFETYVKDSPTELSKQELLELGLSLLRETQGGEG